MALTLNNMVLKLSKDSNGSLVAIAGIWKGTTDSVGLVDYIEQPISLSSDISADLLNQLNIIIAQVKSSNNIQ